MIYSFIFIHSLMHSTKMKANPSSAIGQGLVKIWNILILLCSHLSQDGKRFQEWRIIHILDMYIRKLMKLYSIYVSNHSFNNPLLENKWWILLENSNCKSVISCWMGSYYFQHLTCFVISSLKHFHQLFSLYPIFS